MSEEIAQITPKEIVHKMLARDFGLAEFKRRRWAGNLTESQTLEDALKPDFWSHLVENIMGRDKQGGCGDIIEIYKADTALYAELLIVEIGVGFVKTKLLRDSGKDEAVLAPDSPFKLKWNLGKRSHDVVRKTDDEVMKTGFQTKESAITWINNHTTAMAA